MSEKPNQPEVVSPLNKLAKLINGLDENTQEEFKTILEQVANEMRQTKWQLEMAKIDLNNQKRTISGLKMTISGLRERISKLE